MGARVQGCMGEHNKQGEQGSKGEWERRASMGAWVLGRKGDRDRHGSMGAREKGR